jgi:hypothetical protein
MPTINVKPNTDKATGQPYKIRLPDKQTQFLPDEGAMVEKNKFWNRRLRDGSVVEIKAVPTVKAVKATTKE